MGIGNTKSEKAFLLNRVFLSILNDEVASTGKKKSRERRRNKIKIPL